ncbi:MAG: PEP-CTERM sorting domain-containing protein [Verrucomicrobia bacterium]|nr:MAG: PEP-CTERM sorting domain-containing protein [Verrucomicrobiota bacterium]TAE86279.1 MAG: PEP-CTERM sorting domain-containing protein [Verrucomicrobiota bacterium]TAF23053.1 MAG: PEP-CTERM sorting domain-containing protein [Verrucomicrobiota bacterium]TAF39944.1 MAG: PEP-CTERM sorting domain-containing protein [Verrucomicrobiota bacterium]
MKTTKNQSTKAILGALTAASAAGSANAAIVQITLSGNRLNSQFGNSFNALNADLTGDSTADITISGVNFDPIGYGAIVLINGNRVSAQSFFTGSYQGVDAQFAGNGVGVAAAGGAPSSAKYLNPITFIDSRINSGASTQGYLEVESRVSSSGGITSSVTLTRLVFNDASTTLTPGGLGTGTTYTEWAPVPETSSLGLLALGAGGLLARRRRAAHSA